MSIVTAGNRAFRALASILDLPGTEHLSTVDLAPAAVVLDLSTLIQAELVEHFEFIFDLKQAVGGTTTLQLLPLGVASVIRVQRNGKPVIGGTGVTSYLDGKDVWITGFGAWDSAGDMGSLRAYWRTDDTSEASRVLLWLGDTVDNGMLVRSGAPTPVSPFPWFRPAGASGDSPGLYVRYGLTAGGSADTVATVHLFAAEPGVLPYK